MPTLGGARLFASVVTVITAHAPVVMLVVVRKRLKVIITSYVMEGMNECMGS